MRLKDKFYKAINIFSVNKNRPEICEEIADEHAIDFALWLSVNCIIGTSKDGWFIYQNKEWLTADECLDIFKRERLKTV